MNTPASIHHITNTICNATSCCIAYINGNGYPVIKAMNPPRKQIGLGEFLFSTNTDSQKVKAYLSNKRASLYFYNPQDFVGITFWGEMSICTDTETKHSVWVDTDTFFYPNGKDSNDYCVMRFVADSVEVFAEMTTQTICLK